MTDELVIDEIATKLAPKLCPRCKKMGLEEVSYNRFKCKKCKKMFRRLKVTIYKFVEI